MKKIFSSLFIVFLAFSAKTLNAATEQQLTDAYKYAYDLYAAYHFDQAKGIFKKIAILSGNPGLNANSLYYYSQCAFRTQDFDECVKALNILAKKWPNCAAVQKGFVTHFAVGLINQVTQIQSRWDYYRYQDGTDDKGQPIYKESVPPGFKIKRISFKLGFGLYRVLQTIQADSPETAAAKQKLEKMLNIPITLSWVDEKAAMNNKWGHPADFLSLFTMNEKKDFSKAICERMFYNWKVDKLYEFLDMFDEIRNLNPRFSAKTREYKNPNNAVSSEPTPKTGTNASSDTTASGAPSPPSSGTTDSNDIPPPPGTGVDPFKKSETQNPPPDEENIPFTLANLFKISGYNPYTDSYTNVIEVSPTDLSL